MRRKETVARFQKRAVMTFENSEGGLEKAIAAMMSDHSAKGRLQSGATLRVAIRLFEEHSRQALDQSMTEAGKLIDHRGRKWKAAMEGIGQALDHHLLLAPNRIAKVQQITFARAPTAAPSTTSAVDKHLNEACDRLRFHFAEFRDGWTAPVPSQWKDRHPLIYAIVLLLVGALIGQAPVFGKMLFGDGS